MQKQLSPEWNHTQKNYPYKCIHQLFEEQVERTPDTIAVVFQEQQLTYRQLNHRANQLAQYLQTLGVGAEVLVGICLERSLEMIVGLLAILKAGGAYLPLDIEYPKERLAFMLADTQISVLLTQKEFLDKLPQHEARVICLDTDWEIINQQTPENPTTSVKAENLAYIMYTSGSTGQPKGVSIVHRGVVRLVIDSNYINLEPDDVIAFTANFSFDAATFEIWGALLNGAKLVVISKNIALSPHNFVEQIHQQGITVLFLTTALFNLLAREVPCAFKLVKHLLFGGETVDLKWVREVLQNGSPQRLLHVYGPTENTTFSTWYLIEALTEDAITIPIGQPIANTQAYILDENLQPVAIGATGELYIGGDGLARGYLNRPELTKEKFISNPLSKDLDARLYKTGDLARYLPDHNIEFLGRIDNQVKIRGFRIELGEIERAIAQHPDVRENVVLARQDATGEKRLAAYIVPHQHHTYRQEQLRSFIQQRLPEYMLPSAFVFLESLPLTANGKVDRHKLPAPGKERPQLEQVYVAPQSDLQRRLASIWSDLLNIEQVGIDDNFFDLGATSTLAVQIAARVQQELGIELSVVKLFQYPTIAGLAKYLNTEQNSQQSYDKLQNRAQRQQAAASARRRHSQRGV